MQIANTSISNRPSIRQPAWSAVGAMSMCVAMLIASEFMPMSLLTPIARDLGATQGLAGQAISISGLFAVVTSLLTPKIASHFDRRHVLVALSSVMLVSLAMIAAAPNFAVLMVARSLLGVTIGGFWALATATVMRLVPAVSVPKALGLMYTGNAVASALAAPIGSYFEAIIGWRGTFWALVPLVAINIVWQWTRIPAMPSEAGKPPTRVFAALKRSNVAFAMVAAMLSFCGAFTTFTYLRPFLEIYTRVSTPQLSLLLLGLGAAGFVGTLGATLLVRRHLYSLLRWLPLALSAVTLMLPAVGHDLAAVGVALFAWGALNGAIPVVWSTWLSEGMADDVESGGGLLVAAIQLSIMSGAALGGVVLDHFSIKATLLCGAAMLIMSSLVVGNGRRVQR